MTDHDDGKAGGCREWSCLHACWLLQKVKKVRKSLAKIVKFSSQKNGDQRKCQTNDGKSRSDINGKGEKKNVQLGKDPGQDSKNKTGEKEDGQ